MTIKQPLTGTSSSRMRDMNQLVSHETASLSAECSRDKSPFSFVRGQDSTMWNIVWVSPQGHRSVSISRYWHCCDSTVIVALDTTGFTYLFTYLLTKPASAFATLYCIFLFLCSSIFHFMFSLLISAFDLVWQTKLAACLIF